MEVSGVMEVSVGNGGKLVDVSRVMQVVIVFISKTELFIILYCFDMIIFLLPYMHHNVTDHFSLPNPP